MTELPSPPQQNLSDKEIKKKMKPIFHENYEKYYPVSKLASLGFHRSLCSNCGRGFWSIEPRDVCGDTSCVGSYEFIGKPLTQRKLGYQEAWNRYCEVFKQWDYRPIQRYPVVARWYEELYFTAAGINVFQPYIVEGKQNPPYQRVLEPQMCLRFNDLDNVGITGRHYSAFIMVGQHVFNNKRLGESYWMDDGIEQIYTFLKTGLEIPEKHIIFHEDVWSGGGNFGPSIEYFAGGCELGNQVYIQYNSATMQQLDTRVIDMGASLERWAWFSSDKVTSYEVTFPKVIDYLYKASGYQPNTAHWKEFMTYAGLLNADEAENISDIWKKIANNLGLSNKELRDEIYPLRALYTIADHTRNLLFAIHDGALPSNVGGGYNLRNILRRCFSFIDEYQFNIDLNKVFEIHANEIGEWFTELKDFGSLFEILELERTRYKETREKNLKLVKKLLKDKKTIGTNELIDLYDSQGLTPELVQEVDHAIPIPDDFYAKVQERHEKRRNVVEKLVLSSTASPTKQLYYEATYDGNKPFEAEVLDIVNKQWIVLDRTHFYPEGGGQVADIGTINKVKVVDVQIDSGIIYHKVENVKGFHKGQKVTGQIDWERRYNLMKLHSATHIINGISKHVLGNHIWQAGAKKTPDKAHIDITHYKSLTAEEIEKIEVLANHYINDESLYSKIQFYPRDQAESMFGMEIYQGGAIPSTNLRIVSFHDHTFQDNEACSGTHLKSTTEIGFLKIISAERIQDGVVRLTYEIGENAVKRVQKHEKLLQELSTAWKVGYEDVPKTGLKFFEEWKKLGKEVDQLQQQLLNYQVSAAVKEDEPISWVVIDNADQKLVSSVLESHEQMLKSKQKSIIVYIKEGSMIYAATGDPNVDLNKLIQTYAKTVKGGKIVRGFQVNSESLPLKPEPKN